MPVVYAGWQLALLYRRASSLRRDADGAIAILRDKHRQRGVRRHTGRYKHRRDHQQPALQIAVFQIRQDAERRIGT